MHDKNIAIKLLTLLKTKGISQKELARKAGIDVSGISKWMSGKSKPTASSLEKISKALKVPLSYFEDALPEENDTVGKRIIAARQKLGLTQKDFANRLNISMDNLKKFEADITEPPLTVINKLSDLTNESVSRFCIKANYNIDKALSREIEVNERTNKELKHSASEIVYLKDRIAFYEKQILLKDKNIEQLKNEILKLKKLLAAKK